MADIKFYKSMDEDTSDDKFKTYFGSGTRVTVSWDKLLPFIEHITMKKPHEHVAGIKVDKDGVTVKYEKDDHK